MPYYKTLVHIPGGKELKIENSLVPEELFHAVQKINTPDIIEVYQEDLQLTDELHKKLHKPKEFNTYVVYSAPYSGETDTDAFREFVVAGIKFANLYTKIESVYSYQIVRLEYFYADDFLDADDIRAERERSGD